MNFGEAIEALKNGKRVCRSGWNGKGMWLKAIYPEENSLMDGPYIYISDPKGKRLPWLASQQDIFAEDWSILEG